ncbi:MAG: hypothetical protein DI586_08360 [Micavibrio aeruginosavorus]|uniref:Uncharacterized protein n=1 Tax=Micavibrio aeruginosavorus TaxID=349221 RepID=A0A2W5HMC2_9BACT|nr:MAG: hypothetical protein DI586_08360 [Micavibrio aeruginosavorus]
MAVCIRITFERFINFHPAVLKFVMLLGINVSSNTPVQKKVSQSGQFVGNSGGFLLQGRNRIPIMLGFGFMALTQIIDDRL